MIAENKMKYNPHTCIHSYNLQRTIASSPTAPLPWSSGGNHNNNNNPNNNTINLNNNGINNNTYNNYVNNNCDTNLKSFMGFWGGTKNIIGITSTDESTTNNGNKLMSNKPDISEETYEVGIAKDIRALELRLESELELEEHEKLWSHPENPGLQK